MFQKECVGKFSFTPNGAQKITGTVLNSCKQVYIHEYETKLGAVPVQYTDKYICTFLCQLSVLNMHISPAQCNDFLYT